MLNYWRACGNVAVAALILTGCKSEGALTVDSNTPCSVVATILDAPTPDRSNVRKIMLFVEEIYREEDQSFGRRGKAEIIPRMSQDGFGMSVATTTARCRRQKERALKEVALDTYRGMRAMQETFGLVK